MNDNFLPGDIVLLKYFRTPIHSQQLERLFNDSYCAIILSKKSDTDGWYLMLTSKGIGWVRRCSCLPITDIALTQYGSS